MRINRYIASCGYCSRRKAEEFVKNGEVRVNGRTTTDLATDVDESRDVVTVRGAAVSPERRKIYVMFHKPKGCACTRSDEKNRRTIFDCMKDLDRFRLFSVGRLDYNTEGLLLMTNDGDLSNALTQPSAAIPKTYAVKIEGALSESERLELESGAIVDDIKLKKSRVTILAKDDRRTMLEIVIFEGKNREIRKMFEQLGKPVVFLKRIAIGALRLSGAARGKYRFLTQDEISYLKSLESRGAPASAGAVSAADSPLTPAPSTGKDAYAPKPNGKPTTNRAPSGGAKPYDPEPTSTGKPSKNRASSAKKDAYAPKPNGKPSKNREVGEKKNAYARKRTSRPGMKKYARDRTSSKKTRGCVPERTSAICAERSANDGGAANFARERPAGAGSAGRRANRSGSRSVAYAGKPRAKRAPRRRTETKTQTMRESATNGAKFRKRGNGANCNRART